VIVVDSSVWIDYLRGVDSVHVNVLDSLLGTEPLAIGDLILTEVLQGFSDEKEFNQALKLFNELDLVMIGGRDTAIEAARNYRKLRSLGFTIRKTIDTLIATRCILSGHELLHNDRDFDAFEKHLGLRCVIPRS
jgi:hypothetical protein